MQKFKTSCNGAISGQYFCFRNITRFSEQLNKYGTEKQNHQGVLQDWTFSIFVVAINN